MLDGTIINTLAYYNFEIIQYYKDQYLLDCYNEL